ncbi:C9orf85 [Cordylochernes scorpioides]|uniref:C9orf85 n=1 Tax=Cordylochernes scorpioides TaxID=51811 RepID=A0ABY6K454_9ARAC|nr:C9orf85 [Cordylochernes scorpioides]
MSSQKGNTSRTRSQKHKNDTTFKNNLYDKTVKTRLINSLQIAGCCQRCKEVLEWKIKYKKYKPLTQPKKWTIIIFFFLISTQSYYGRTIIIFFFLISIQSYYGRTTIIFFFLISTQSYYGQSSSSSFLSPLNHITDNHHLLLSYLHSIILWTTINFFFLISTQSYYGRTTIIFFFLISTQSYYGRTTIIFFFLISTQSYYGQPSSSSFLSPLNHITDNHHLLSYLHSIILRTTIIFFFLISTQSYYGRTTIIFFFLISTQSYYGRTTIIFFFLISTQSYYGIKLVKPEIFDGVCRGRVELING